MSPVRRRSLFRIGGAQAIAAMAYGTETVPQVNKIVGPGNVFVNEAKRQVFGPVGIDQLAGPSEIFVVADSTGDPELIATYLLAQAEHDAFLLELAQRAPEHLPDTARTRGSRTGIHDQVAP